MNNNKLASKLPTTARKYALDWLNILGHQKSPLQKKKIAKTVGCAYGLVRYCTVHHIASARGRGVLGSWNGQIDIDWMPGTISSDFPYPQAILSGPPLLSRAVIGVSLPVSCMEPGLCSAAFACSIFQRYASEPKGNLGQNNQGPFCLFANADLLLTAANISHSPTVGEKEI